MVYLKTEGFGCYIDNGAISGPSCLGVPSMMWGFKISHLARVLKVALFVGGSNSRSLCWGVSNSRSLCWGYLILDPFAGGI